MNCDFNGNWGPIKERMEAWWAHEDFGRPVLAFQTPRVHDAMTADWSASSSGENSDETKKRLAAQELDDYEHYWTNFDAVYERHMKLFSQYHFTHEAYPRLYQNISVSGLAVFLGAVPMFQKDTIWCEPHLDTPEGLHLSLDPNNKWLQWSLDLTRRSVANAGGRYVTGITELLEHADTLAALFGTQDFLYHMMDYPEDIHRLMGEVQAIWRQVYDMHYELVREPDGFSHYGPFQLMGKGRVAKIQCDMSAMLSTEMFDEFVLPHLKDQAKWLDRSMYHLDGTDAVRHLDSVLSIPELHALQWTPGAGQPDGGDACWDFIYERALNAGKSIYALVAPNHLERFVKRFGSKGVYIVSGAANPAMGDALLGMVETICKR